jgi:hypothetical protein
MFPHTKVGYGIKHMFNHIFSRYGDNVVGYRPSAYDTRNFSRKDNSRDDTYSS